MLRKIVPLLLLVPALAVAQGVTKNPVNANGASTIPLRAPRFISTGPTIPDDAGTVTHAWFDGRTTRDTKSSCTWEEVGAVAQTATVPGAQAWAGPFAANNLLRCSAPSDAMDISTGDMTLCVVFTTTDTTTGGTLLGNGQYNASGYYFEHDQFGRANFVYSGAACTEVARSDGGAIKANRINVACGGLASNVPWAWANGGTANTGPSCATPVAGSGRFAMLGVQSDSTTAPATTTRILEVWVTRTPRSAALLDAVYRAVFPN